MSLTLKREGIGGKEWKGRGRERREGGGGEGIGGSEWEGGQ